MPGPSRRLLRMVAKVRDEAALLLRSQSWRVVRIRGSVGSLEGPKRAMDQVVLNPDDHS